MSTALIAMGIVILVCALLRFSIVLMMFSSGIVYLWLKGQDIGLIVDQTLNSMFSMYVLLAVPMFIFAGNVMNASTVSERIWSAADVVVGRLRGGMGHITVLMNVVMSSMSGSAISDAAGPGMVSIRMMEKVGQYPRGLAVAIAAAAACLGPIIPPSIPMVIYALVSGASVGALFLGGLLPGLCMTLLMMAVVHFIATRRNMPREEPVPRAMWPQIIARGALPLSMPIVLLGGIYSGAFTPTEAAAVAALHALVLSAWVFKALSWKSFWAVVLESARASAVITIILAGSFMLNYAFTAEGVPQGMAQWVDGLQLSRLQFLLMVNVLFLVLGCFLDVSVLLLVFVPMLLPAAKLLGVDLVHFGVLVVLNMMIGLIHPPFGMLLFVTKALTGIPIGEMVREGWLFLVMLLGLLLCITLFPEIVLWLPHAMGYTTA